MSDDAVTCSNCGLSYRIEVVEKPEPSAVTGEQYCPICGELVLPK
jgi:transcription elongation factor Elf1